MGIELLVKFLIECLLCTVAFMLMVEPTPARPLIRIVLAGVLVAMAITFVPLIPFGR
jgi:hypothetical protein